MEFPFHSNPFNGSPKETGANGISIKGAMTTEHANKANSENRLLSQVTEREILAGELSGTHTYKPMDTGIYSISIGLLKSYLFRGTRAERRVPIFTSSFGLINQTPIDWEMLKGSCSNAKSLR